MKAIFAVAGLSAVACFAQASVVFQCPRTTTLSGPVLMHPVSGKSPVLSGHVHLSDGIKEIKDAKEVYKHTHLHFSAAHIDRDKLRDKLVCSYQLSGRGDRLVYLAFTSPTHGCKLKNKGRFYKFCAHLHPEACRFVCPKL